MTACNCSFFVHTCAPAACTYSRINLDAHEKASEERIRTLRFQADAAGMRAQRLMRARLRSPFITYLLDIAGAISLYLPVLRDVSLYFADVVTDCMVMVQLYLLGELRFAGCYLAVLVLQMSLAYWTTLGHLELLVEEVAQAKRHASFSATPRQTTQRTLDQRGQHSVWFRWLGFPFGILLLDVLALWQPVVDLLVAVLRKRPPLACSRSSRSGEDIVADSAADSVSQDGDASAEGGSWSCCACFSFFHRLTDDEAQSLSWWWLRGCVSEQRIAELDQLLAQYSKVRTMTHVVFETLPNGILGCFLFSFQRGLGLQDVTALWLSLLLSLITLTKELWVFRDELKRNLHGSSAADLLWARVAAAKSLPHDAFARSKLTSWQAPEGLSSSDLSWSLQPLREPSNGRRLRSLDLSRVASVDAERVLLQELPPLLIHEWYDRQRMWTGRPSAERRCVPDLIVLRLPRGCTDGLPIERLRCSHSVGGARGSSLLPGRADGARLDVTSSQGDHVSRVSFGVALPSNLPPPDGLISHEALSPQLTPRLTTPTFSSPTASPPSLVASSMRHAAAADVAVLDAREYGMADAVVAGSVIGANPEILSSYKAVRLATHPKGSVTLALSPIIEFFETVAARKDSRDRSEGIALAANEIMANEAFGDATDGGHDDGSESILGRPSTSLHLDQILRISPDPESSHRDDHTASAADAHTMPTTLWVLTQESLVLVCRILHPIHEGFLYALPLRTKTFLSSGYHQYKAIQIGQQTREASRAMERVMMLALFHNALEAAEKLRGKLEALLEINSLALHYDALIRTKGDWEPSQTHFGMDFSRKAADLETKVNDAEMMARGHQIGGKRVLNDRDVAPALGMLNEVAQLLRSIERVDACRVGTLANVGTNAAAFEDAIRDAIHRGACEGERWSTHRIRAAQEHLSRAKKCKAAIDRAHELVQLPLVEVDAKALDEAIEEARLSGASDSEDLAAVCKALERVRVINLVRQELLEEAGSERRASRIRADSLEVYINVATGPDVDIRNEPSGKALFEWARGKLESAREVQRAVSKVQRAMTDSPDILEVAILRSAVNAALSIPGTVEADLASARIKLEQAVELQQTLRALEALIAPSYSDINVKDLEAMLAAGDKLVAASPEADLKQARMKMDAARAFLERAKACTRALAAARDLIMDEDGAEKPLTAIRLGELEVATRRLRSEVDESKVSRLRADVKAQALLTVASQKLQQAAKAQEAKRLVDQLTCEAPSDIDESALDGAIKKARQLGVQPGDLREASDMLFRAQRLQVLLRQIDDISCRPPSQVDCAKLEATMQSALATAALDERAEHYAAHMTALDLRLAAARAQLKLAPVVQDAKGKVVIQLRLVDGSTKPASEIITSALKTACEQLLNALPPDSADPHARDLLDNADKALKEAIEVQGALSTVRQLTLEARPNTTHELKRAIKEAETIISNQRWRGGVEDPKAKDTLHAARIKELILEGLAHSAGKDPADIDQRALAAIIDDATKLGATADQLGPVQRAYSDAVNFMQRKTLNWPFPSSWDKMQDDRVGIERFLVTPGSQEYDQVESDFMRTLDRSKIQIREIERIQHARMWQGFATFRQGILDREKGRALPDSHFERKHLFHGTDEDTVPKILMGGFKRDYAGRNAVMYGRGVYFARDAKYSAARLYSKPNANGVQHIFMVRVVVGEFCKGNDGQPRPNVRQGDLLYDSTVDDVSNPSIFVAADDAQYYPEYLVKFTQS